MKNSFIIILFLSLVLSCSKEPTTAPVSQSIIPKINRISPEFGFSGQYFSIIGKGFGNDRSSVDVFLDSTIAEIKSLSDTIIVVKIPQIDAGYYNVKVNVNNNVATSPVQFKIDESLKFSRVEFWFFNFICNQHNKWSSYDGRYNTEDSGDTIFTSFYQSAKCEMQLGSYQVLDGSVGDSIYIYENWFSPEGSFTDFYKCTIDTKNQMIKNAKIVNNHYRQSDYYSNTIRETITTMIFIKSAHYIINDNKQLEINLYSNELKVNTCNFTKHYKSSYDFHYGINESERDYKFKELTDSSNIKILMTLK